MAAQRIPQHHYSAEDFAAMPRDGWRAELIEGEVITMPAAFSDHGRTAMRLGGLVTAFVLQHGLGEVFAAETGFLVTRNPDTVRAPDFAFIQQSRVTPGAVAAGWGTVIPDAVAEVVSSGDRQREIDAKVQAWLAAGVQLVWVLYPQTHTISVQVIGQPEVLLGDSDHLTGGAVIPGLAVPVASIFG